MARHENNSFMTRDEIRDFKASARAIGRCIIDSEEREPVAIGAGCITTREGYLAFIEWRYRDGLRYMAETDMMGLGDTPARALADLRNQCRRILRRRARETADALARLTAR